MRHVITLLFAIAIFIASSQYLASQQAPSNDVRISVFRTGVNVYDRGEWSVVGIRGINRRETDVEATVVLFFEKAIHTQYKRKFWIPARSTRITWLPVRTPADLPKRQTSLQAYTMNIIDSDGERALQKGTDPRLYTMSLLPLNNFKTQTGAIHNRRDPSQSTDDTWPDEDAADLIGLMRESGESDPSRINFRDVFLPPYPHSYDGLDSLLISNDRWLADSAAPLALRSWIARGGKAWVLLDYVGQETVDALLGSDSCCQIVDRVELTEFTLETPQLARADTQPQERWESERPVDFVRVLLTEEATVHSRIGEWPAAFSVKQGNGEVLITTLAARGWHHQLGILEDPPAAGVPSQGATHALEELGEMLLTDSTQPELPAEKVRPILQSQIGYKVPSRQTAGLVLGVNCLVLLVGGLILARADKLQHLVWVLPTCALVTAGVMVSIGKANVSQVPATLASVQLLELSSGSNQVHATTYASFYSPTGEKFPMFAGSTGLISADGDDGLKQLTWDGAHNSHVEEFQVAPGAARFVKIRNDYILRDSVRASGRFGPEGLVGHIDKINVVGEPSDAIIAAPISANSGVDVDASGDFVCREGHLLSSDEFLAGTILTDEQQRRQEIYRSLFSPTTPYPARPTLFLWGDAEPIGVTVPQAFEARGATLWAIPLGLERTPSGGAFVIPATFIRMHNSNGVLGTSNVYNPRTGEWLDEATTATRSMFQFVLPAEVMPAELTSATVALKIHAPSREVQLLGTRAGTDEIVAIKSWQGPSGVYTIQVTDRELLHASSDEGLLLGLSVGETNGNSQRTQSNAKSRGKFSTWQATYLRVSVSGKTL